MKQTRKLFGMLLLFLAGAVLFTSNVLSDTSFSGVSYGTNYVNPAGYQTAYQTYYSPQDISNYWPILDQQNNCQARQDLILQVPPGGCQPSVVTSDLLQSQNVPVFCQIDALKLNPLIDISSINSISFTQKYPAGVSGIGFHPANAALRTGDALLGSPVLNNIGYAVVILKQNPNQSSMPSLIVANLTGSITYDAGNALGIGSADFILSPMDDQTWASQKSRQSFWQGRYYVRLDSADPQNAQVSIYQGDNKITSTKVTAGKTSSQIYLPGFYCQASLQVEYDGFTTAENKARLEIDGDTLDVYAGSNILNGKCRVDSITIDNGLSIGSQVTYNPASGIIKATVTNVNSDGTYNIIDSNRKSYLNVKISQLNSDSAINGFGNVSISCGFSNKISLSREPLKSSSANSQQPSFATYILSNYYFRYNTVYSFWEWSNDQVNWNSVSSETISVPSTINNVVSQLQSTDGVTGGTAVVKAGGKLVTTKQTLQDKVQSDVNAENAVNDAIKSYQAIADQYPQEKQSADLASTIPTYGETALGAAVDLADKYQKFATEASLINKFIQLYPNSALINSYNLRLQGFYSVDSSQASNLVYIDNKYRSIKLVDLESPAKKAGAYLVIGNNPNSVLLEKGNSLDLSASAASAGKAAIPAGTITLTSLTADTAVISAVCAQTVNAQKVQSGGSASTYTFRLGQTQAPGQQVQTTQTICGQPIKLDRIDMEQLAIIKLLPNANNVQSQVNVSIGIGIEKSAIQLSPDKTKEMIATINQSIQKWQSINNNIGNLVSGLKVACFATSAVLTAKSFINGVNGEGIARQMVMTGDNGWNVKCQQMVAAGQYKSVNECYSSNSANIDSDVAVRTAAINKINTDMEQIGSCKAQNTGVLNSLFGSANMIDRNKCATDYYNYVKSTYGGNTVNLAGAKISPGDIIYYQGQKITVSSANVNPDGTYNIVGSDKKAYSNVKGSDLTTTVNDMLTFKQGADYNSGAYTLDELKNIELNIQSGQAAGASDTIKANSNSALRTVYQQIGDNKNIYNQVLDSQKLAKFGIPDDSSTVLSAPGQQTVYKNVVPISSVSGITGFNFNSNTVAVTKFVVPSTTTSVQGSSGPAGRNNNAAIPGGTYVAGLAKSSGQNAYTINELYLVDTSSATAQTSYSSSGQTTQINTPAFIGQFSDAFKIKNIVSQDQISYANNYINPQIKYFETEPYKGMPAIVPFDIQNGWYAATKQTLPAFGGQGAFDASGKVSSFWLCNVGPNHVNNFEEGLGDDICEQMNMNTGQATNQFPGLSASQAQTLATKAIKALNDASNQYGSGKGPVKITGVDVPVQRGSPALNIPSAQCQDFMSPSDCNLLFNVCDPVICPSSRCDLGGAYPVANVVQTGIIGSVALCLPNFGNPSKGGVAIPVCLTGINAGLDSYISVLKAGRDCLQNSLDTGSMVGICNELTSIYTCEFFWSQVAPFANLLLPKIIELAYTGGQPRGGGEYMTVIGAWQNTKNAIDYFTNMYAVNSLTSFKARSIEEAGSTFCKAFVSASAPTSIKTLIEPDSPPQFSAWFSSTPYTTVTLPATSQYKVYYHIFGGKDSGVYYNVYLKSSANTGYYYSSPILTVASGFINRGNYADQTKDFTAPTGYQELCVDINGQSQCGFKEVSTSFAVNYLSDSYAQSQINQTNINSESGCVSGSANAAGLLTSPNPQSAIQNSLLPQDYNTGITRICATSNPGSSTDPTRYVAVGNCGDSKVICWLDKNSANNAISQADVGIKNATLSDLQAIQQQALAQQPGMLANPQASIDQVKQDVDTIVNTYSTDTLQNTLSKVTNELAQIDNIFGPNLQNIILNSDKAQVLYLKARLKGVLAQAYYNSLPQGSGNSGTTSTNTNGAAGNSQATGQQNTQSQISPLYSFTQSPFATIYFRDDGTGNSWQFSIDNQVTWTSVSSTSIPSSISSSYSQLIIDLRSKNYNDGVSYLLNNGVTTVQTTTNSNTQQTSSSGTGVNGVAIGAK